MSRIIQSVLLSIALNNLWQVIESHRLSSRLLAKEVTLGQGFLGLHHRHGRWPLFCPVLGCDIISVLDAEFAKCEDCQCGSSAVR
jgi:hypothetical protein